MIKKGLAILAAAFLLSATDAVHAQRPPNIVVIYTDDLGYGDVSS